MYDNGIDFTKEKIDYLFKELSKEYKKLGGRNMPVEIVLIGGAAIVESYGFRNMTTDIDAIIPAMGIMKDAINRVGDKYGLPNGWLNADFMQTASYSPKLSDYSKHYKSFNQVLNVRYISGEYLIAMKLKSGREYKYDLSDIIGILAEHEKDGNPITMEAITGAVCNLYGGMDEIDEKSVSFIHSVMKNKRYEEMYDIIRETEKNTKSILLAFDRKYPGVLEDGNIDSVIENADKKCEEKTSVRATLLRLKQEQKTGKQITEIDRGER